MVAFSFWSTFPFGFHLEFYIPFAFGFLLHKYASSDIRFCMQSWSTYVKLTGNFNLSLWWKVIGIVAPLDNNLGTLSLPLLAHFQ